MLSVPVAVITFNKRESCVSNCSITKLMCISAGSQQETTPSVDVAAPAGDAAAAVGKARSVPVYVHLH